jgi:hypothetical protein
MPELANDELTPASIPPPDAEWGTIAEFALTFNGYKRWGSFAQCAEIANAERHGSLDDLRTCLFFERQRWQHFGDEPDEEALSYIRGVVEKIRASIEGGAVG